MPPPAHRNSACNCAEEASPKHQSLQSRRFRSSQATLFSNMTRHGKTTIFALKCPPQELATRVNFTGSTLESVGIRWNPLESVGIQYTQNTADKLRHSKLRLLCFIIGCIKTKRSGCLLFQLPSSPAPSGQVTQEDVHFLTVDIAFLPSLPLQKDT